MNFLAPITALGRWLRQPRRLRDYTPKGLFGRSLLIVALPVALMQIGVLWMFFDSQWENVTAHLSEGVAGDVGVIADLYQSQPDPQNLQRLSVLAMEKMSLSVAFLDGESLPRGVNASLFSVLDRTLRRALSGRVSAPFWFDTAHYPAYVDIRVQTSGGVLRFIAPRKKVFSTTGHIFVFWLIAATFVQMGIAVIFIRNQVRPIQRLAEAADRFGRGQDDPGFSPSGAREVRQAAAAFIKMRDRMGKYVDQRTIMLAGVSHDLRTPLTRLKLHLALDENNDESGRALEDVREMEAMLDGYLAFARDDGDSKSMPLDFSALAQTCVDDARRGGTDVQAQIAPGLWLLGRGPALRRCIGNLLDNAGRYGEQVRLSTRRAGDMLELMVEDDGPGIAPDRYAEAFRPFGRLDEGRNLNTGGVGLGLAIARDAVRAHGGDIMLGHSKMGGLLVALRLPSKEQSKPQD